MGTKNAWVSCEPALPCAPVSLLRFILAMSLFALLHGCGDASSSARPHAATVVVDLAVVAKALGRDEVMQNQLESARNQLSSQLTELAEGMKRELEEEKAKLPEKPSVEEDLRFQDRLAEAKLQLQETRVIAQQQAQQLRAQLVSRFRAEVAAAAAPLARQRGAGAVLVIDTGMLWFDPSADITDEVIAEIRARDYSSASPMPSPGVAGAAGQAPPPSQ